MLQLDPGLVDVRADHARPDGQVGRDARLHAGGPPRELRRQVARAGEDRALRERRGGRRRTAPAAAGAQNAGRQKLEAKGSFRARARHCTAEMCF